MTGDGMNDAPALKAAHVGVAMGGRGTEHLLFLEFVIDPTCAFVFEADPPEFMVLAT